jgi:hypothetical protein
MNTLVLLLAVFLVLSLAAICSVFVLGSMGKMKIPSQPPWRRRKHMHPSVAGHHR